MLDFGLNQTTKTYNVPVYSLFKYYKTEGGVAYKGSTNVLPSLTTTGDLAGIPLLALPGAFFIN